MKTTINMIPSAADSLRAPVTLSSDWLGQLAIETDSAYGFTVSAGGNRTYRGSLKVLAEESANNAGTRRLLLKVELPLSSLDAGSSASGCCCTSATEDTVPSVSVHTVITVPKQVAAALTKGEQAALDHVTVAIRLLQNLVGSLCYTQVSDEDENGGIVADGAVVTKSMPGSDDGNVIMPVRFNARDNRFYLDVGISNDAPIWGLIGGLRQFS